MIDFFLRYFNDLSGGGQNFETECNNESVNSKFKYKLEYKSEYKLGGFNTRKLVPDITDYKLEFMTQKFKFG